MRPLRRVGAQEGPQDLPGGFRISGAGVRDSNCSRNFWIHGAGILCQHLHAQIRFVPLFGNKQNAGIYLFKIEENRMVSKLCLPFIGCFFFLQVLLHVHPRCFFLP